MIDQIFQFNAQALGVRPKSVPLLEYKHATFSVKALREEADELEDEHNKVVTQDGVRYLGDAVIHSDPQSEEARWQTVKSVDACLDAAYFAIGGLARAGLTVEQAIDCFLAVHTANMTKKLGVAASRGDMGVPDAVKGDGWVGPENTIYKILFGAEPTMSTAANPAHWNADGSPRDGNPLLG